MNTMSTCLLVLIATAGIPTLATAAGHSHLAPVAAPATIETNAAGQPESDGEIKKIDKEAGKITVKHGPLANLNMPPMTMIFKVKDPAMLEQAKAGDKVKFTVEKLHGAYTITALQAAR
ncbi:MAG: copper-binding protein [Telluria sp.]